MPPSIVVQVQLLPPKPKPKLPPPQLPPLSSRPVIVAIAPKVSIARPPDAIRAAPAPPAKPSPPPATAEAPTPPVDYLSRLAAHLNAYKNYPYEARIHRREGTVKLRFTLDRSGYVLSSDIMGSSGSASLDDEAREMVRRANPFPPLPKEFPGRTLELEVPVIFSLN